MISPLLARPPASPEQHRAQLGHVVASERARRDRGRELATVACLLPLVAEDADTGELGDRDLGLPGAVRAHQADVLAWLE